MTYQIDEGPKVKIKKIFIEGNDALSKRKIKGAMKTKKRWLFSFVTKSGYFQKKEMELDLERIRDLYFNNGYINVIVSEPKIQLTKNKKGMFITGKGVITSFVGSAVVAGKYKNSIVFLADILNLLYNSADAFIQGIGKAGVDKIGKMF